MDVSIDVSESATEFGLDSEQTSEMIDYVVKGVTAAFAKNWELQAQRNLHSLREVYKRAIYVGDSGRYTGFVQLRGVLPNMIENGAPAFDLKPSMLASPKAKSGKNGKYITIPFSWGTSGSTGEGFSGVMPKSVQNLASKGIKLKMVNLPKELQIPKSRASIKEGNKIFTSYQHKSSIYAGITKITKTYEKVSQSRYMSFRRVSDKSNPMSWIHKGFQEKNLAGKAMEEMNLSNEVEVLTDEYLKKIGF